MHVVSWGVVCKDKKYGGLGIRRLKILNWALPSKCLWRFANKHNSMWRKFIQAKYKEIDWGWITIKVRGSFGVSLWRTIRRG